MARRRNAWITPLTAGDENVCRQLSIPENFTHIVSGALAALTEPYRFEQLDPAALTPARCAELMSAMLEQYLDSTCSGTQPTPELQPLRRVSPTTGRIEQYSEELGWFEFDDGETYWPTPPDAPERPVGADPVCLAAANAANVIMAVYDEMLDAWNDDELLNFAFGAFLATLGAMTAVLFGAPAIIVSLVWQAFGGAYAFFEVGTQNARNADTQRKLTCLFKDYITVSGDVISVNWQGIMTALITSGWHGSTAQDFLLGAQLNYIMQVITYEGFIHAAATTAVTQFDCAHCDYSGCAFVLDFDTGVPFYVSVGNTPHNGHAPGYNYQGVGAYSSNGGVGASGCLISTTTYGTDCGVQFEIDLGEECTITTLSYQWRNGQYTGGNNTPKGFALYNAQGQLVYSAGYLHPATGAWGTYNVPLGGARAGVRYIVITVLSSMCPVYIDNVDVN